MDTIQAIEWESKVSARGSGEEKRKRDEEVAAQESEREKERLCIRGK